MSIPNQKFPAELPALREQDLRAFNTLGLKARATAYLQLSDQALLPAVSVLASNYARPLILGGGSNVVLPDRIDDLVVHVDLRGITRLPSTDDAHFVQVCAGETWHTFVGYCVDEGLDGLENLALIPGQVGAAPVQNIGAYGLEVGERLHSVMAWDIVRAKMVTIPAHECALAYRDSRFKHEPNRWIIVSVVFRLPRQWQPRVDYPDLQRFPGLLEAGAALRARDVFDAVVAIRRAKLPDPAQMGNAGSFFKNPIVSLAQYDALHKRFPGLVAYGLPDGSFKLAAGWLIDQAGWKGRRLGRAAVHDRQALVLINAGDADATDILALARAIQDDVWARYGVALEPEPIVVSSGKTIG